MEMIFSWLRAPRDGRRGGSGYKGAFTRLENKRVAGRWGWKGLEYSGRQGLLEMFKKKKHLRSTARLRQNSMWL